MSLKNTRSPDPAHPEWIRLPRRSTVCPHSGLNRSAIDKLVRPQELNHFKAPVKSRILKLEGEQRGIRLINFASLWRYIERRPSDQPGD
jgi:hypothetical protein